MIKRHKDYLESIGLIEKAFVERVEVCLARMRALSPEPITDILVEDVVQESGSRAYLHLSGYTTNYILDANTFLTNDSVAIFRLSAGVDELTVAVTDYDFIKASEKSRINVQFDLSRHSPSAHWTLQGSRGNCDHIWAMTKKHIRPQLKK